MHREHSNDGYGEVYERIAEVKAAFEAAATTPSADESIDLRGKALAQLDELVRDCHVSEENAIVRARQALATANSFVKEKPWRSTLIAASTGVLAGAMIVRG
jgi:ElaB/YqjD/DUF883 family membrane-anchored ribosome-binding protein